MEFKFRANDSRPPAYFFPPPASSSSSSSAISHFSEQAVRAKYRVNDDDDDDDDDRRRRRHPDCTMLGNEMMSREMEKKMIREEIIAEETLRRRRLMLEAEVRRDLMLERQMAMQSGLSYEESVLMRLNPTTKPSLSPLHCIYQFDDYNSRRLKEGGGGGSTSLGGGVGRLFLHQSPQRLSSEGHNNRKLTVLARPDPNLCGVKRKAATPPDGGADELLGAGLKKPKEEWSCALCQVSATSERGLNEHLIGKKHKAKEARLIANKMAKSPCSEPLPKQAKLSTSTAKLELEAKVERTSVQVDKNNEPADNKIGNEEAVNENDKLQVQKKKHMKQKLKKKNSKTAESKKKKFKLWCEMCQVGANSEVVMEAHKKGKKHLVQLQELSHNVEAVTEASSSKATEKAINVETVADKANEKMKENVLNNEKTTEAFADNEIKKEETVADNEKIENVVSDVERFGSSSFIN